MTDAATAPVAPVIPESNGLNTASKAHLKKPAISNPAMRLLMTTTALGADQIGQTFFQAKEQR